MSLTDRMPTPPPTDTTPHVEDSTGTALLRGIAFGLPLALLLWSALTLLAISALR